ncbi:MAG: hypothetical protein WA957_04845 [Alteraurantiacibacter sp.]
MSKPLSIAAAFSVFAMAAFTLFAAPAADYTGRATHSGTATQIAVPVVDRFLPVLSGLIR